jgi:hypothetical protein
MSWDRHRTPRHGGSAPATPGFNAVAPEWLINYGAADAAPAVPAAESTLGSHPCVALSSAQVLPEWINPTSPTIVPQRTAITPLTSCLTPGVHFTFPNRLRRLPSPAHFRRRSPGHAAFTALEVLHSRPSTGNASLAISLSLIGLLTPVPPGDPVSPPEVTHCSSVPCHPQTPWCGG